MLLMWLCDVQLKGIGFVGEETEGDFGVAGC